MATGEGFDRVTKYLDIVPATESPAGLSATRTIAHPYAITPVRDIKKLHYGIKVPAFVKAFPAGETQSYVIFQFNYTAGFDFRISSAASILSKQFFFGCSFAIRYRIGGTVFRYFLGSKIADQFGNNFVSAIDPILPGFTMYAAEIYVSQLIKSNFVIEVWSVPRGAPYSNSFAEMDDEMILETSKLVNPSSADQSSIMIPDGATIDGTLYTNFPEPLPTNNTDTAWLTN